MQLSEPPIEIPQEAVDYIRCAFRGCNRNNASTLSRIPNVHEIALDMQIITHLSTIPARRLPGSGVVVQFRTHFLGSPFFLDHPWEIADIGVAISITRRGHLLLTKAALLQSKRLYAIEDRYGPEADKRRFREGFGGVFMASVTPVARQLFTFTVDSRYQSLALNDPQVLRIEAFTGEHEFPVYYLLYNPLDVPMTVDVPATAEDTVDQIDNAVGVRVVSAPSIRSLRQRNIRVPRYRDVRAITAPNEYASFEAGWRFEDFIVDLCLGCHEGYYTTAPDATLYNLFNARSRPISAAFSVGLDLDPVDDRG